MVWGPGRVCIGTNCMAFMGNSSFDQHVSDNHMLCFGLLCYSFLLVWFYFNRLESFLWENDIWFEPCVHFVGNIVKNYWMPFNFIKFSNDVGEPLWRDCCLEHIYKKAFFCDNATHCLFKQCMCHLGFVCLLLSRGSLLQKFNLFAQGKYGVIRATP